MVGLSNSALADRIAT
jgi:hypothetical protein